MLRKHRIIFARSIALSLVLFAAPTSIEAAAQATSANAAQAYPTQMEPFLITRPLMNGDGEFFRLVFAMEQCPEQDSKQYEVKPTNPAMYARGANATAHYCRGVLQSYFGWVPYESFKQLAGQGNLYALYSQHRIGGFQEARAFRVSVFDEEQALVDKWASLASPGHRAKSPPTSTAAAPLADNRSQTRNGEISRSAARAFGQSPALAFGRASGLVTIASDTVTANEIVGTKSYQLVVRNATCSTARQSTTCKYDLKMLGSGTAFSMRLPVIDSGWVTRSDVFTGTGDSLRSAALDSYMQSWAGRVFQSTPSPSKDDSAERSAKQWECRKRALEDGAMAFCPY